MKDGNRRSNDNNKTKTRNATNKHTQNVEDYWQEAYGERDGDRERESFGLLLLLLYKQLNY